MDARARLRAELAAGLARRESAGLLRRRTGPRGLDFASNDVLGYARDPWIAARVADAVRAHGVGAGAARLLRGHLPVHEEAERRLAAFSGREAALLFGSGYLANLGLVTALVGPGDRVLSDRDNHASLIDAARLSRAGCEVLDLDDPAARARALAAEAGSPRTLVVVESVVSTSGRLPDLTGIAADAERAGALLVVDEAHATGLFGARGSGRVEAEGLTERVTATVHTGGKALGVAGAWVAGDALLVEHLVNVARPFLFSTAPMPALAAGLSAALERLSGEPGAAAEVLALAAGLRRRLAALGFPVTGAGTHLVGLRVGAAADAQALSAALGAEGYDVRALRPPTVREGESALRIVPRRGLPPGALDGLLEALARHAPAAEGRR